MASTKRNAQSARKYRERGMKFDEVFAKFWNITYSCKINMKIYSFFSW